MVTFDRLCTLLIGSGLVDWAAIGDAEAYDGSVTLASIEWLHKEMTAESIAEESSVVATQDCLWARNGHTPCPHVQQTEQRRLVACWNACEGIETYALELMTGDLSIKQQITATGARKPPKLTRKAVEYRMQRDELLEALQAVVELWDHHCFAHGDGQPTPLHVRAREAIAKVTGETK